MGSMLLQSVLSRILHSKFVIVLQHVLNSNIYLKPLSKMIPYRYEQCCIEMGFTEIQHGSADQAHR